MELALSDGFQLIYGANEKGKSTIMAFIRTMLYGLAGSRKQLVENDRRRYMPWEGNRMGGYLLLENAGIKYRLERHFATTKAGDSTVLMEDISGKSLSLAQTEEPGLKLLGLTENEFTNTVFIGQLSSTIGTSADLLGRLSNLAGSGDVKVSHLEVDKRLRQAQTELKAERGTGGKLNEARSKLEQLLADRETAISEALLQTDRLGRLEILEQKILEIERELQRKADIARWQTNLDFLEKHSQMTRRLEFILQEESRLRIRESELENGNFQVTREFVKQGISLEQNWQNRKSQIEQNRQQVVRSRDKLSDLKRQLQAYGPVLAVEPAEFNKLNRQLAEQQRAVESRRQDLSAVAAEKNRLRERENTDRLTRAANDVAAARQKLQNTENEIKAVAREIERLREQEGHIRDDFEKWNQNAKQILAKAETELKAAESEKVDLLRQKEDLDKSRNEIQEKIAACKEIIRSGTGTRDKAVKINNMVITAGIFLVLAGIPVAILLSPLIWTAVATGVILIGIGLIAGRKKTSNGEKYDVQEMQILESELRITESKYQSLEQMYRYVEKSADQAKLNLKKTQDELLIEESKATGRLDDISNQNNGLVKDKSSLEERLVQEQNIWRELELEAGYLRASLDKQEQITADSDDVILQEACQILAKLEGQLVAMVRQSGCESSDMLAAQLLAADNLRLQIKVLEEEHHQDEADLALAEKQCADAASALVAWLEPFISLEDPHRAADILSQLGEKLEQAEKIRSDIMRLQQAFTDRLDGQSWEEWQSKAVMIREQLQSADPQPEMLGKEEREILNNKRSELQLALNRVREERAVLDSEVRHFSRQELSVSDIDEQIIELERRIKSMEEYYQILDKARRALNEAADEMQSSFGPALNRTAAHNLARLTGSRYDDLKVDREFSVKVADPDGERFREWQYLSGGTVDQVYLSLRLAISDQISAAVNRLPLLLDDILIQYDQQRADSALDWLIEKSRNEKQQMLLFTCQERLVEKIKAYGLPVHYIND